MRRPQTLQRYGKRKTPIICSMIPLRDDLSRYLPPQRQLFRQNIKQLNHAINDPTAERRLDTTAFLTRSPLPLQVLPEPLFRRGLVPPEVP